MAKLLLQKHFEISIPVTRLLLYLNTYISSQKMYVLQASNNLTVEINKNTSNNASASMNIREMPVRAPASSADELG